MYRSIVQMFDERVKAYPLEVAQLGKNEKGVYVPVTYIQLQERVRALALALKQLGLRRGDFATLLSDNRPEWLALDLAILALGAADVPRGRDAMEYEIEHIIKSANTSLVIVENKELLDKLYSIKANLPFIKKIVIIDPKEVEDTEEIILYEDLLNKGFLLLEDSGARSEIEHQIMLGGEDDIATLIFTSGTTGLPKGVMTTNRNFLYQVEAIDKLVPFKKGERWLSVLPVWHSFERILQYLILFEVNTIAYSKPIGKIMLTDIQRVNPEYLGSVPRIWETVKAGVNQNLKSLPPIKHKMFNLFLKIGKSYHNHELRVVGATAHIKGGSPLLEKLSSIIPYLLLKPLNSLGSKLVFSQVREKLGTNFKAGISGGGSMSKEVEEFFGAIGIKLLNGYGMTESSPVIGISNYYHPKKGFMHPLGGTELKVISTEDSSELPLGKKGELIVKGEQVMKGYYHDEVRTSSMIDRAGYLHTGDLAILSREGDFTLVGRVKDTIVLSGGENIEPIPIEQALSESEYIESVVVIGQDRKCLGALIVIDKKNTERYLKREGIPYVNRDALSEMDEVKQLINSEITSRVGKAQGFKPFEQVARFALLEESFQIGKELSAKQEVKRKSINEIYKKEIESLYK